MESLCSVDSSTKPQLSDGAERIGSCRMLWMWEDLKNGMDALGTLTLTLTLTLSLSVQMRHWNQIETALQCECAPMCMSIDVWVF